MKTTDLYIIQSNDSTRPVYWLRNAEHGCGWSPKPKQAFSKSALQQELGFMLNNDCGKFNSITITRLWLQETQHVKD